MYLAVHEEEEGAVETITLYYSWDGDFQPTLNIVSDRMESLGLVPAATVKVLIIFFSSSSSL